MDLQTSLNCSRLGYMFFPRSLYVPLLTSAHWSWLGTISRERSRTSLNASSPYRHRSPSIYTQNIGHSIVDQNYCTTIKWRSVVCASQWHQLAERHLQSLLDDIRVHRIPVDFLDLFDSARLPFYDGVHRSVLCRNLAHVI